jgi:hypothetical protein
LGIGKKQKAKEVLCVACVTRARMRAGFIGPSFNVNKRRYTVDGREQQ